MKFRVYDNVENEYPENQEQFFVDYEGVLYIAEWIPSNVPADTSRYIVEKATGRKDKNGVEIYENDKVIWRCSGSMIEGKVIWYDYGWAVQDMHGANTTRLGRCSSLRVIGTIYDKENFNG